MAREGRSPGLAPAGPSQKGGGVLQPGRRAKGRENFIRSWRDWEGGGGRDVGWWNGHCPSRAGPGGKARDQREVTGLVRPVILGTVLEPSLLVPPPGSAAPGLRKEEEGSVCTAVRRRLCVGEEARGASCWLAQFSCCRRLPPSRGGGDTRGKSALPPGIPGFSSSMGHWVWTGRDHIRWE